MNYMIGFDTFGLLAAWAGAVTFLIASFAIIAAYASDPLQRWWAKTSPRRTERRIQRLRADLAINEAPDSTYLMDLVSLYGTGIMNLVVGAAVLIMSIQILDLAPPLQVSTLPLNIDKNLIIRYTGLFFVVTSYFFVFRLSYLAMKIHRKTLSRRPGFAQMALQEIADLHDRQNPPVVRKPPPQDGRVPSGHARAQ